MGPSTRATLVPRGRDPNPIDPTNPPRAQPTPTVNPPTAGHLTMDPNDDHAPEKLLAPLRPLMKRLLSKQDWDSWCHRLSTWTAALSRWTSQRASNHTPAPQSAWVRRQQERRAQNRQTNRTPTSSRNRAIGRKVAIQKEYRLHPKKCMTEIRKSPPPLKCPVPLTAIKDFFTAKQQAGNDTSPIGPPPPPTPLWPTAIPDVTDTPISDDEVLHTIRRIKSNSAPGPDRLRYSAWKSIRSATIADILNTCRVNGRIPLLWKQSTTILIHKGEDPNHLDNWRPIALQNMVYKIYAAIIAQRISDWALSNSIVSPSQKGFLPFEVCLEHGFVLKSIFQDARKRKKPANIVWLDLKDAFGSVPHPIVLKVLSLTGLQGLTAAIVKDIYMGSTTSIQTGLGRSPQIHCLRKVKQGCPLSPILFNLVMEVVIWSMEEVPGSGYQIADTLVQTRSYADDLCAVASSPEVLQAMLTKAQSAAKWAGLTFNPRKCAALTIYRGTKMRQQAVPFRPTLEGEQIPSLPWEGRYKYLGCRVGADPKADLTQAKENYLQDCDVILRSDLADWQKLDALHRFARPRLIYLFQNMELSVGWARDIDVAARSFYKLHLKLPRRTTSNFLYASTKAGGLGLPNIEDELYIFRTSSAFKLLFYQGGLRTITSALARTADTRSLVQRAQEFLNTRAAPGEGKRGDIKTIWSEVRSSLTHCQAEISTTRGTITCNGKTLGWLKRNHIPS